MTRVFAETPSQSERLEKLNSSYITGMRIRNDIRECCVTLIDNVTGNEYHRGYHPESYSKALDAALETVTGKPRTTAEIAADAVALADENAKLRDLVEQLRLRGAEQPAAQEEAAAPSPTRRRSAN
jgi:hypothetical protein